MDHLNAKDFLAKAESGEIPIDGHDQVLRIAYIYMVEDLWDWEYGVFGVVEKLHKNGWSFGQGALNFNRCEPGLPSGSRLLWARIKG